MLETSHGIPPSATYIMMLKVYCDRKKLYYDFPSCEIIHSVNLVSCSLFPQKMVRQSMYTSIGFAKATVNVKLLVLGFILLHKHH